MTITPDEVVQAVRDWVEALLSRDFDRLWAFERESVGFGYRSRDARPMGRIGPEQHRKLNEGFLDAMDHYSFELESVEAEVRGNLGLA